MGRFAILVCLFCLAAADAAWGDDGRHYFKHWLVLCHGDQTPPCSANAYALNAKDAKLVDFQLRLPQRLPDAEQALLFLSYAHALDATKPLTLRVDGKAPVRLTPVTGYLPTDAARTYAVVDRAALSALIAQMKQGARVRLDFTDAEGQAGQTAFSLWGLTAALEFLGSGQTGAAVQANARPHQARPATPAGMVAPPAAEDWSRDLTDLLPAMRRCLIATPGGPASVTKAWPMDSGRVGVRTLGPDGRRWTCVAAASVAAGAGDVAAFDPVGGQEQSLPGEGAPLFTSAGQQPPAGDCIRHERARDGEERFVGWLSYRSC